MTASVIQPKRPLSSWGWYLLPPQNLPGMNPDFPYDCWAHRGSGLGVISAVEVASEAPGLPPLGPAYHISVSKFGQRCSSADALWVLSEFDMVDAQEDNHVPNGKVRNFWRYVADNLSGFKCACVKTEAAMLEDKGDYVWRG